MVMTFMLQYYDKAVLSQAALFEFLQSLDLQTLVSAGPPPVYSTIRFSQGLRHVTLRQRDSLDHLLLWLHRGLLSTLSFGSALQQWECLWHFGDSLGHLPIVVCSLLLKAKSFRNW